MSNKKRHFYDDSYFYMDHPIWKEYLKVNKLIARTKMASQQGWVNDGTFWRNPKKLFILEELPTLDYLIG